MAHERQIPRGIWVLGFVSLFMDLSSEMIHALLPIYMVSVLEVSMTAVGVIEGIAEATAAITKVFSGLISDRLGRRKLLAVLGYGLSAVSKPVFPLAAGIGWLIAARFIDRLGKSVRGAPRDALVADIAPAHLRGASFGLRQSLDTIGAFLAPLVAIALMWSSGGNYSLVFWIAVVPAFAAVALLVFGISEPRPAAGGPRRVPFDRSLLSGLGRPVWVVTGVGALFSLARFSEAFLLLRANSIGIPAAFIPLVLVAMNIVFGVSAYPAGRLSDKVGRTGLLASGVLSLLLADVLLGIEGNLLSLFLGVCLWGLHLGLTQGVFAALIADCAPESLRATAFGLFNLAGGLALFGASLFAGLIWDQFGAHACFIASAGLCLITLLCLPVLQSQLPQHPL